MTQQSELEKTQLEIAKLQLEQERRKLAGMQRRSEAVGSLGRGAKKVADQIGSVVLGALGGALGGGVCVAAIRLIFRADSSGGLCPAFPDADLLYRIGCALGAEGWVILPFAAVSAVYGAYTSLRYTKQ